MTDKNNKQTFGVCVCVFALTAECVQQERGGGGGGEGGRRKEERCDVLSWMTWWLAGAAEKRETV